MAETATTPEQQLAQLFQTLDRHIVQANYSRAKGTADKSRAVGPSPAVNWFGGCGEGASFSQCSRLLSPVLALRPEDKDAFYCKLLCFLHGGEYKEALACLDTASSDFR
jgi:hypothetical protein